MTSGRGPTPGVVQGAMIRHDSCRVESFGRGFTSARACGSPPPWLPGNTNAGDRLSPPSDTRTDSHPMAKRTRSLRAPLLIGGLAIVGGGLFLAPVAWWSCGFQGCPDPGDLVAYQPGGAPIVLDRQGEEFARLHPLERRVLALDSLPEYLPQAVLAVEDQRFFEHRGVDWRRVVGAALRNVRAGGVTQGASTLSMQLARTTFPERIPGAQRRMSRKLLEVRVAQRIEARFSKEEILELYLNHVYMGGGAYGVEAGARHYFGRSAVDLGLAESAFLAGVVRGPVYYDPRRNPEAARDRRDLVLRLMVEQDRIAEAEVGELRGRGVEATETPPSPGISGDGPYFVEAVRRELEAQFGEELYRSPLRIHTTLDRELQRAAGEELVRQLEAVEEGRMGTFSGPRFPSIEGEEGRARAAHLEGAVVVLDPSTGDVLALVGGRDHHTSRFNRALRAQREMGSAFKPFVYAAALAGGRVASQPLADRPFTYASAGNSPWSPRNSDGGFEGQVSMRRALAESLNIPTVRLAMATGMGPIVELARRTGISDTIPPVPAAALGTGRATPLELASAYVAFANQGQHATPRWVIRVEDDEGTILHESEIQRREVLDPGVAYLITDMLRGAVDRGTGRGVRTVGYGGPAAGKTGTTQDARDVWFVGYTPEVVGVVWMGFDQPSAILPGASGGGLAAPVWGRIMARAHPGGTGQDGWIQPEGVVAREVDGETGRVVGTDCPSPEGGAVRELFLAEYIPESACPERQGIRERVGGFFRRLVGREEEESSPGWEEGDAPDFLEPGASVERFLGFAPVPVRPSSGQGGAN